MFGKSNSGSSSATAIVAAILLLIVTFALIGFVALSVLTGNNFGFGNRTTREYPTPKLTATVMAVLAGTPDPSAMISFKSAALGFELEYPRSWRKNEKGLQIIFSPSTAGLDPDNLQDAAIWVGIPVDNTVDPADLLKRLQVNLSPNTTVQLDVVGMVIGGQSWYSTKINFESEQLGGEAVAIVATTSKNEVSYFIIAAAPAEQWNSMESTFEAILNNFHFTAEAVLRPTDATPPPTPTPTPTPVFYVVQSGDSLLKIALQYGVDVEALATRNEIDDPRSLRTGTKLIIPIKRR